MSDIVNILLQECEKFYIEASKKLDPKAEVRNRGDVVFPAESHLVKDHKDHFQLNTIEQARAALSYAGHYNKAPPWYKGTLEQLKATIRRKVKKKYPSIDIGKNKKTTK